MNESWKYIFTERELKEIEFCRVYAQDFAHGTDGHTIRIIVAKMEKLLLEMQEPSLTISNPTVKENGDIEFTVE